MAQFHFEQIEHPRYKYRQLDPVVRYLVDIPGTHDNPYIKLKDGHLATYKGYCWDGPSGPAVDTVTFMRGSLIHDALYQLMREGVVDTKYRKRADKIMRAICLEDGMSKARAWWVYTGVRIGARNAARRT